MSKRSLKELLDEGTGEEIHINFSKSQVEDDSKNAGMCNDCGDHPAEVLCTNCEEPFCNVCFGYIHRTGKRKLHKFEKLGSENGSAQNTPNDKAQNGQNAVTTDGSNNEEMEIVEETLPLEESAINNELNNLTEIQKNAKYIPMRLTIEERTLLRLLNAALDVSEYVDHVDCFSLVNKTKRIVVGLREICTILIGLTVASGSELGHKLMQDKELHVHAEWFQQVFEIGRRYKIMNPEKMRSNYGKMVYMIMDSRLAEIKDMLEFDLYKPILTVEKYLEEHNAVKLLDEELLTTATMEVVGKDRSRRDIQNDIRRKEHAIEKLTSKYGEPVRQAIYSLGDFHSYIAANNTPVMEMLSRLTTEFSPDAEKNSADSKFNLGIISGMGTARLTHNHARQYQYVLQSLILWSEIMSNMYLLWKLADDDLLEDQRRYVLGDTGQGLNRMKPSPKLGREMHTLIGRAQRRTGSWVGSSVVHLGDTAVPNSFFFLDKYLQVPRILNPVNSALQMLPKVLKSDESAMSWVESEFGSLELLEKTILVDFFRHAFDGSGADNFYDAGSCIDGRLTSAWNWANNLHKKSYYKHFLITGFIGFDGSVFN